METKSLIYFPFGPMKAVLSLADLVAETQASVLITGETGVGKELLAQRIHGRSKRVLIEEVNCAGVPESLLEAELFGHVRGSFTGAVGDRKGRFEMADKGTLFFDEIGEMTPKMQASLLRVIETGIVEKVGGKKVKVDVRIIAATKRNLEQMVEDGSFRDDLYHRLNVFPIYVPPLRDRRDDIKPLLEYFVPLVSRRLEIEKPTFSDEAWHALQTYYWPGNVRELENLMQRLTICLRGKEVQVQHLPDKITSTDDGIMDVRDPDYYKVNRLYSQMILDEGQTFWKVVRDPFMARDLTRDQVRGVIDKGLVQTSGNYKQVATLFNLEATEYKRLLNFLRKNKIQPDFKQYRRRRPAVA